MPICISDRFTEGRPFDLSIAVSAIGGGVSRKANPHCKYSPADSPVTHLQRAVESPEDHKPGQRAAKAKGNVDKGGRHESKGQQLGGRKPGTQHTADELAHAVSDGEDGRHRADLRYVHMQVWIRHHDGRRVCQAVARQVVARVPAGQLVENEFSAIEIRAKEPGELLMPGWARQVMS